MDFRQFTISTSGTIGVVALVWYLSRRNGPPQAETSMQLTEHRVRCSDSAICAQILACEGYNSTGARNLYTDLKSRAIPNERLTSAFGIDNSFTTSEVERRKKFNAEAGKKIKMTDAKWQEVGRLARDVVREAVSPSKLTTIGQTTSVALDSLVRSVCLRVTLQVLFKPSELKLEDENVAIMAESINSLWIQSKGSAAPLESDKYVLNKALTQTFPQMRWLDPRENPLNLIIPAYESLWRVVLSGFLQVTFVKVASAATWRSILAKFLASPTPEARTNPVIGPEASAISADFIVKEALRLYPTVKRVYRKFHMDNETGPVDVQADIEACQRTEALWGADSERFVPSRWINASDEARDSFMAFGSKPFVCPAKHEFGPMIIGILVAALAEFVSSEDWLLKLSESNSDVAQRDLERALNGDKPLVSDRSTYEGIRIIRK